MSDESPYTETPANSGFGTLAAILGFVAGTIAPLLGCNQHLLIVSGSVKLDIPFRVTCIRCLMSCTVQEAQEWIKSNPCPKGSKQLPPEARQRGATKATKFLRRGERR